MNKKTTYLLFALFLLVLRLVFNYSYELIPGINGGYYPLQVRTLLETGHLGFSDMPIYFYLNATIVYAASFFTSIPTDKLIIEVSKILDGVAMPRLTLPLFLIATNFFRKNEKK